MSSISLIALIHGSDRPGLVARTASWIYERGGNIIHADQHRDDRKNIFFQRIEWTPGRNGIDVEAVEFPEFVRELGMDVSIARTDVRPRIALFVSKIPHCFMDFLLRWEIGEMPCELVGVVSNHETFRDEAEHRGLEFLHTPTQGVEKSEFEAAQRGFLKERNVDLVVMARYMQILSREFLEHCGCPVINIHHSFLPAFVGARPYHQAHERGVKLIGATAHYATPVLDDGPIIHQAVTPVSHRHGVDDLVRLGRDLEKSALAQAVRWHLQHRILSYDNKTVVFG